MQRRGRLILGGIVLFVAILLECIWIVPATLDWNRYRDGIAALASQRLGLPVHIGGGVSLQLLPQPILTANDVSVAGGEADEHGVAVEGGAIGLRAKALRLRVALGPLLAGKVDARELTLQAPDVRLPWPPPPGALSERPPSWLTGLQAQVEDGRLQVGDLVLEHIAGTVTTDPDTGTLAAAGMLEASGRRWRFTARLGKPGRDGSAPLDVSLDGQGALQNTGGTFSGQIGADGALSGRVAGRGADLSLLMPAPALPWRTDGRLNAAGGLAVADELAVEIGGAPATGAVALRVTPMAQLDVAITAGRLDLDAWLPALLARHPASLRAGIPTGVDLSAEAATLAGGTVRRLRGGVDLAGGVVRLREVTAVLPGDAELSLSGQVGTDPRAGPAPRFDGQVRVGAPDLRATLRWLAGVLPGWVGALPPGVLHTAELSAHVTADATEGAAEDIAGSVDGSRVGGSASFHLGGAAGSGVAGRPQVAATLALGNVVLDPWVPDGAGAESAGAAVLRGLRAADAQVQVTAEGASWRGLPLGAVAVAVESEASRVVLRRLEAAPLGGRFALSGQVGDGDRVADVRLEASAAELEQLRPLLAESRLEERWAGVGTLMHGPGSLLVQAAGPPDAVAVRLTATAGDLRVEAQPVGNVATRHWAGPVSLHHPGAPRLLESLGVGGTRDWLGDGSLSLVGLLDVVPGRVEVDGATVSAGAMRGSAKVVVEGRRAFGTLQFESLPLPGVQVRSAEPLPVGWLSGWEAAVHVEAAEVEVGLSPVLARASADVSLAGGVLTVEKVAAVVHGGRLAGTVRLDASGELPQLVAEGQVSGMVVSGPVFGLPVDLIAGQVDAWGRVSASGHSASALVATAQGSATVRVQGGVATGFDLTAAGAALGVADAQGALAAARAAVLGGNTSFAVLEGSVGTERGVVGVQLGLSSPAGRVVVNGGYDVLGGGLDLRLVFKPVLAGGVAPGLEERVIGPLGGVERTPELAEFARWLADRS